MFYLNIKGPCYIAGDRYRKMLMSDLKRAIEKTEDSGQPESSPPFIEFLPFTGAILELVAPIVEYHISTFSPLYLSLLSSPALLDG